MERLVEVACCGVAPSGAILLPRVGRGAVWGAATSAASGAIAFSSFEDVTQQVSRGWEEGESKNVKSS